MFASSLTQEKQLYHIAGKFGGGGGWGKLANLANHP